MLPGCFVINAQRADFANGAIKRVNGYGGVATIINCPPANAVPAGAPW